MNKLKQIGGQPQYRQASGTFQRAAFVTNRSEPEFLELKNFQNSIHTF
ncbi:MAG: hypothetical protein K0R82_487 [Flavipsychrobacter sp.]|nr:hypothetical protein [Flavipsychrobacter sp.]